MRQCKQNARNSKWAFGSAQRERATQVFHTHLWVTDSHSLSAMVVTAVRVQIRRPHSIHPNKYLALSISYTNIHRGCCQHKLSSRILAAPPLCPCARFHLIYSSHLGSVLPELPKPSRPSLNAPPHQWQTLHSPLQKAFSSQRSLPLAKAMHRSLPA